MASQPSSTPSTAAPTGMTAKVNIRMQQIARMRVAGHKDAIIAGHVGLTPAGLARIVALPEYKDLEAAILDGTISKMDEALAGRAELLKDQFKQLVPMAVRGLLEAVQQRRDLRTMMKAAEVILKHDPDHTFGEAQPEAKAQAGLTPEQINEISAKADKAAKETIQ